VARGSWTMEHFEFPRRDWIDRLLAAGQVATSDSWAACREAGTFSGPVHARPWVDDAEAVHGRILIRHLVPLGEASPYEGHTAAAWFAPSCGGPPGNRAHGGSLASAFDDVFGAACHRNQTVGPTANLTVQYHRSVFLEPHEGIVVRIRAKVERVVGKKIFVAGDMCDGDTGTVYATASGIFVRRQGLAWDVSEDSLQAFRKAIVQMEASQGPGYPRIPCPVQIPESAVKTVLAATPGLEICEVQAQHKVETGHYVLQNPKLSVINFAHAGAGSFLVLVAVSVQAQGPPGCVHGGCIMTLLDHAMSYYFISRGELALTATLAVDYLAFTPVDSTYVIEVRETSPRRGSRCDLEAKLLSLHQRTVHAIGTSAWVLRPEGRAAGARGRAGVGAKL